MWSRKGSRQELIHNIFLSISFQRSDFFCSLLFTICPDCKWLVYIIIIYAEIIHTKQSRILFSIYSKPMWLFSMLRYCVACCMWPSMHLIWEFMWIFWMRIGNLILVLPARHWKSGCSCSSHCPFIDVLLSAPSHRWFVDLNQIPFNIIFFRIFLFMNHEFWILVGWDQIQCDLIASHVLLLVFFFSSFWFEE